MIFFKRLFILLFLALPECTKANITTPQLIQQNSTINDKLHKAILNDSAKDIQIALKQGADINHGKDGRAPILWALLLQKFFAVETLIINGADINISYLGKPLIIHALKLSDIKSAFILLKNGAPFWGKVDVNNDVMSYVLNFIGISRTIVLEFIQELINRGYPFKSTSWMTDINVWTTNGWYTAIRHSNDRTEDVLRLLLKNNADPNQIIETRILAPGTSWTPLLRAVEFNNLEAIRILLEAGADINQIAYPKYKGGPHTALSYALEGKNRSLVQFLIESGAKL